MDCPTNHWDRDPLLTEVAEWMRSHYFGKFRGVVVDTNDPNTQGRIQVRVPAVLGDLEVWALPCVPYAGDGVGLYLLPEPDTGVWVEFEGGDPSYPVWTGCFWGSGQIPDTPEAGVKVLRTGAHTIRLDDDEGELLISSDSGAETAWTDEATTTAGSSEHTVSSSSVSSSNGTGSVEVSTSGTKVDGSALEVR
jgi:uncharacterized protein involved in type VI secretion and phage assembly